MKKIDVIFISIVLVLMVNLGKIYILTIFKYSLVSLSKTLYFSFRFWTFLLCLFLVTWHQLVWLSCRKAIYWHCNFILLTGNPKIESRLKAIRTKYNYFEYFISKTSINNIPCPFEKLRDLAHSQKLSIGWN